MTDYILIQAQEGKVPLLAKKDHPYRIKFGAYELNMEHWLESWMAYLLYSYERSTATTWLRDNFQDISPNEIDEFIHLFKEHHPVTPIEYSFQDIPCIATEEDCMEIYHSWFKGKISLTLPQETESLGIIKSDVDNKQVKLKNWFWRYCRDYGVHAHKKREQDIEHEALADMFCQLHGVQFNWLRPPRQQPQPTKLSAWDILRTCILIGLYISIALLIAIGGSKIDNFFWSGIVMTIGFGMIAVLLFLLLDKR